MRGHRWALVVFAALSLGSLAAQECEPGLGLEGMRRDRVGPRPSALAVADLDADGDADLACADSIEGRVSVLLGDGVGGFADRATYPVASPDGAASLAAEPVAIVAADLDGDGAVDLATANRGDDSVSVLLGLGDGSFESAVRVPAGSTPVGLAAGDLDGDGDLDLVVSSLSRDELRVLQQENGTWELGDAHTVGGQRPHLVRLGDLDGDGDLDAVTANEASNDVSVLLGAGDGTFALDQTVSVSEPRQAKDPLGLTLVDVDGDGDLDALVGVALEEDHEGEVLVLLFANGRFRSGETHEVGTLPGSPLLVDLDGNDALDLVIAASGSDDVTVLSGRGGGGFKTPRRFATPRTPVAMVAGDFDGDERLDLACASARDGEVAILRGRGDRSFESAERFESRAGLVSLTTGDFDQDGDADLVILDTGSNRARVLNGGGNGTFGLERSLTADPASRRVLSGRLDAEDEIEDVVIVGLEGLKLFFGRGSGRFSLPIRLAAPGAIDGELVDIDEDGLVDLVVARGASGVSVLRAVGPRVYGEAVSFAACASRALAVGDLEAGGGLEIASVCESRDEIVILAWREGQLVELDRLATGARPVDVTTASLGDDDRIDLVVACAADRSIVPHLSGSGLVAGGAVFRANGVPDRVLAVDLVSEAPDEVIVAWSDSAELSVLGSLASGGVELARWVTGTRATDIVVADFDASGGPDIAVANRSVTVFFQRSGPGVDCDENGVEDGCEIASSPDLDRDRDGVLDACQGGAQLPWDCTQDARVDIADAVCVLSALFGGVEPIRLPCADGDAGARSNVLLIDGDPDGRVDVSDAVALLLHLFRGGPAHPLAAGGECVPILDCPAASGCP